MSRCFVSCDRPTTRYTNSPYFTTVPLWKLSRKIGLKRVSSRRFLSAKRMKRCENIGRRDRNSALDGRNLIAQQKFDYFLVLDFEATCEQYTKIQPIQEIIEFPVVRLCGKSFSEVDRFHRYVRPTERPQLTPFCTNLTGIVQGMVDDQLPVTNVLSEFHRWLIERDLVNPKSGEKTWTFVTCGDWDLGTMLPSEANFWQLQLPSYFSEWINLKKAFCDAKGYFPNSLMQMLNDLQIAHVGQLHSGIDDVLNICAILKQLAKEGYQFENTSYLKKGVVKGQKAPFFG
ncbi:unnamed protein product [Anisakis simplex]|uniref:ERI1 exoribonuclease 3 (inferred by orthology to a human protein) n=1 Tax=Anisakis simplex TaxID=6269 RepID=A0A0M3K2F7_ANISI|nr:unnamed protein product [Anisakis simplex]